MPAVVTCSLSRSSIPDISAYINVESDPVFNESVAMNITIEDTANWNKIKNKSLGNWDEKEVDNLYQAESDGFLYVTSNEPN